MSRRPRVLFLGPGHSPIVRGRIAPFVDELEALLVTTEPPPASFLARHPGLRVEVLPRPALRRLPRRLFLHTLDYLLELQDLVWRRFRPELIHVHYVSQLDALALLPVRRVPLVLTVMGADVLEDQVPRPWVPDQAVRALFRRAAAVTAKSAFLAGRCQDLGAPPARVHRVPWGVSLAAFRPAERAPARARLGLPLAAQVLLSSRALQPLYGHLELLEALATLPGPARDPLHLVFTRNAEDRRHAEDVARRARELGLACSLLAAQEPEAMPLLYAAADAVVSIPSSDGLPQTLLEALACERPVVARDLEALRELPFATDALVRVPQPLEREALARACLQALAPRPRPGLLAARGWLAQNASFEDSVTRVRALYGELLGRALTEQAAHTSTPAHR